MFYIVKGPLFEADDYEMPRNDEVGKREPLTLLCHECWTDKCVQIVLFWDY